MKNSRFTLFQGWRAWRILGSSIPIVLFFVLQLGINQAANAACALGCSPQNLSLNQNCQAVVQMAAVLDASQCPDAASFTLQLEYEDGTLVPTSPMVTRSELGRIVVRITAYDAAGNYLNHCWNYVKVEDKIGPSIQCDTAYLDCYDLPTWPGPTVTDNCSDPANITLVSLGDNITRLCHPDYGKRIIRTWQATDGSGMSATCNQTILVRKLDTSLIDFPLHRTEFLGTALDCSIDYDLDNDGAIDPAFAGVPTYNGQPMYPWQDFLCDATVTFEDSNPINVNCKKKIIRTWTYREWHRGPACNQELEISMPQFIEIVDTTGPSLVCPFDFTVTTTGSTCDAQVYLPPVQASDDCNAIIRYDVKYPGGSLTNTNGGFANLPVGNNRVTYLAYDACYNVDSCSFYVNVQDLTAPHMVCRTFTTVSLTTNGVALVPAHAFNTGTFDDCELDYFVIRRMDATCGDQLFRDSIEFNCCDLANNNVMVVLRAYDVSGNWNECMIEVEVQDKLPPAIVCPPHITVSCQYPYDLADLSPFGSVHALNNINDINDPLTDPREDIIIDDQWDLGYTGPRSVGLDGYAWGTCGVTVGETNSSTLNSCGEGVITRVFTARTASGATATCFQNITFVDRTPFQYSYITWPTDRTINGGCGPTGTDPSVTGLPTWTGADCEQVTYGIPDDWVFPFDDPNDPACYKILRTHKVIDWCRYNSITGAGIWTDMQTIKVINTEAPVITNCDDVSVCSYDPACINTFIELSINATDDCDPTGDDLSYSYEIDINNDGSFEYSSGSNPFAQPGNAPNEADGTYPIGTHRILWTVRDFCGNVETCSHLIDVKNCKAPTAYCYNGLAAELMPMDLNGDGVFDWGMIELWASDFDAGSSHPCYTDVKLSFSRDTSDKNRMFTCDSLGRRVVELWATSPNGAQSRCITYVDIQDNNKVCPDDVNDDGMIAGLVADENGNEIDETRIDLHGAGGIYRMTDNQGTYMFGGMPYGGTYDVEPTREDDPLNGVTAQDLSIIQRHIAHIEYLNSEYKHFAADANNDDKIDVKDILDLRLLLLGNYMTLPNSDAWVFLDENCQLNTTNPLFTDCGNMITIPSFDEDKLDVDFIGIKVGDVDNDAILTSFDVAQDRFEQQVDLVVKDMQLSAGQSYTIPVTMSADEALNAYQMTVSFDPAAIQFQNVNNGSVVKEGSTWNTKMGQRGILTNVFAQPNIVQLNQGEKVFEITFVASTDAQLSDVLTINSDLTKAIAFGQDGVKGMALRFNTEEANTTVTATTFELFQNRPNPFSNATLIGFNLPEAGQATLMVTDLSGKTLLNMTQEFAEGYNEISLNKLQLNATGVMYYRLETAANSAARKMILLD